MIKLRDVIRECGFDHTVETEIVKFLFLTHNQNSHVCEELLKNMMDGDSLNTILGYAKHVEGTQHSKNLGKAYLDTIKIQNTGVKVEAVTQKHTGSSKKQGSKHRSQSKGKPKGNCHNCATNHAPKECHAYGKTCYNCNKKGHFKQCYRSARHHSQSGARWKSHSNQRQSRHEQHEISTANNGRDQQNDSSWFQYE